MSKGIDDSIEEVEEVEEAPREEVEVIEEAFFEAEAPQNTGPCYLLSVCYSGRAGRALVKLYDHYGGKIFFWYDNTGHKPYCFTDISLEDVKKLPRVMGHRGFDGLEHVERYDLLNGRKVLMTKVIAKDPLSIGGRGRGGIRELLPKAWEARIKYHDCFIFDRRLVPGLLYKVEGGALKPVSYEVPREVELELLNLFKDEPKEFLEALKDWASLFQCPAPSIRRASMDIEVYSEVPDRVPSPQEAPYPIMAVAFAGSDGVRRVLILRRGGVQEGRRPSDLPPDVKIDFFDDEKELLNAVFNILLEYPLILTFNGDNFDLRYLWHRAQRLGFRKEHIPINMGREVALLPIGVHVDLYRFFHNKSIQAYAFGNRYREVTLEAISSALLGLHKVPLEKPVMELTYYELASYCFRDAYITLSFTTFDDNLVMKLIILLMRISRLSMEDVTRLGVSAWIRNLFYYEHRRLGYLIPEPDDIVVVKGGTVTKAVIKGKKYLGAIVMEPKPGVYFEVSVLDFASMYPSIIRRWNLSYDTVRCSHDKCRDNKIPGTTHWVCVERRGLTSLIIGLLTEMRVRWYKPKSRGEGIDDYVKAWYNIVQQALKVMLNASYGVMGAEPFPLYCPPVAESTAAIGRYVITSTVDKAKALGVEVVYGDTDSIFLHKPSSRQVDFLKEWSRSNLGIDLDVDKMYRYVTFSGLKKNYLGVFEDGAVDIKGLVGKKRNTPEFLKVAFSNMIESLASVKSPEDFERVKEEVRKIAQSYYLRLRRREMSLDELAFRVMLSRPVDKYVKTTPQHVRAAQQLASFGREVQPGDLISYVKVRGVPGVKPILLARIDEVDVDKYIGHMDTTFGQVLDALNISFNEILGEIKLEKFFMFGSRS